MGKIRRYLNEHKTNIRKLANSKPKNEEDTPASHIIKCIIELYNDIGVKLEDYEYAGCDDPEDDSGFGYYQKFVEQGLIPEAIPHEDNCLCGHWIKKDYYILNQAIEDTDPYENNEVVGSCCIKYFTGEGKHIKTCFKCKSPNKSSNYYCINCRGKKLQEPIGNYKYSNEVHDYQIGELLNKNHLNLNIKNPLIDNEEYTFRQGTHKGKLFHNVALDDVKTFTKYFENQNHPQSTGLQEWVRLFYKINGKGIFQKCTICDDEIIIASAYTNKCEKCRFKTKYKSDTNDNNNNKILEGQNCEQLAKELSNAFWCGKYLYNKDGDCFYELKNGTWEIADTIKTDVRDHLHKIYTDTISSLNGRIKSTPDKNAERPLQENRGHVIGKRSKLDKELPQIIESLKKFLPENLS